MQQQLRTLQTQFAALTGGPVACTSSTHPANPWTGMPIYETDTGLNAYWNGSAWVYPPQLVAEVVLGSAASSVRLPASGSLPQVFTHLRVVVSAQSSGTGSAGYDAMNLRINGVTASNYQWLSYWTTQGAGSVSTIGGTSASSAQCGEIWNSFWGSTGRGIVTIDLPDYSSSSHLKQFTAYSTATDGGTVAIQQHHSGGLGGSNTAAITSLTLLMGTGNFVSGSIFSLYGY